MNKNKKQDQLLLDYMNGSNDALAEIYSTNFALFLKCSKQYLCSIEAAEDLVHDVITKLLLLTNEERKKRFNGVNSTGSFFYSIFKYAAIDSLRKKRLHLVEINNAAESVVEEEDSRYLELSYKDAGLTKTELLYFELYIQNKRPREISKMVGKATSTVKNLLQSSKRKIIKSYQVRNHLLE